MLHKHEIDGASARKYPRSCDCGKCRKCVERRNALAYYRRNRERFRKSIVHVSDEELDRRAISWLKGCSREK